MDDFKATKELVRFVVALIKAIDASVSDGKLSAMDTVHFIQPALLSLDALKDLSTLKMEITNLKPEQVNELYTVLANELDGTDKTQQIIEKSLEVGVKLFELYNCIKS